MSRMRAFLYALCALAIGGLSYLLAVGSAIGQRMEASMLAAANFTAQPPAPLGLVSTPLVIGLLLGLGLLALIVHGFGRALSIVLFGAAAILVSQLLKHEWLLRPDLFELDAQNTFPSGHMTVFAVIAAAAVWAVPAGLRATVAILAGVLVSVVAWQLLEYGWHRPSDLIGAQALAVLAFAVASWIGPRGSRRSGRSGGVGLASANRILGVILTISGALLVAGGLLLILGSSWIGSDALLLAGGEVALIGASCLAVRTFARLCP